MTADELDVAALLSGAQDYANGAAELRKQLDDPKIRELLKAVLINTANEIESVWQDVDDADARQILAPGMSAAQQLLMQVAEKYGEGKVDIT